jgi:hypothetical protein
VAPLRRRFSIALGFGEPGGWVSRAAGSPTATPHQLATYPPDENCPIDTWPQACCSSVSGTCIDNVVECYGDLAEPEWKFPVGSLIDDASHLPKGVLISSLIDVEDHLPEEVIDGLESLARAADILVNNGPDILWAFANAAGISDEVGAVLDEHRRRRP